MGKITTVTNEYQKYILSQLTEREFGRFSDIKPPKISSNAYSYHLKQLTAGGWIVKTDKGYTLGSRGTAYASRANETTGVRMQPNIQVVLLVQDGYGKVLLGRKPEQPYISHWQLPTESMNVADETVAEAARWAAKKLLKVVPDTVRHVGDCYVRVHKGKLALSAALVHVVRFELDDYAPEDGLQWVEPLDLAAMPLVPGTENIVTRAFFGDEFFFEEYTLQAGVQQALI